MKVLPIPAIILALVSLSLPACNRPIAFSEETHGVDSYPEKDHRIANHSAENDSEEEHSPSEHHAAHKIVVTSPLARDVVTTKKYVCQIHSCRHIELRALEGGYLEQIAVKEGQFVKQGELLFKILPTLYQAKLDSDVAEAQLAQIELQNTEKLFQQNIVAQPEVALAQAKLAKAQAQVNLARAELNFANVTAPFDGIVDKQQEQQGSLVEEGDVLSTLSDNSVMWAYFNVPEARYLEYQTSPQNDLRVELLLANGKKFPHAGAIGAIEADFNNETGNIAFRADFANPEQLLRHGQTGTILLSHVVHDAIVIPQRATFEILAKKYAYVVGEDGVAHQRDIVIQQEMDDIYLIQEGLAVSDKIILEGVRQVRDGEKLEYEYRAPDEVLDHLKYHAE